MVKQYRYPIQAYSLELPAGHMASAESIEEYTKTEVTEETGFSAGKIERLSSYSPSTELSDQGIVRTTRIILKGHRMPDSADKL